LLVAYSSSMSLFDYIFSSSVLLNTLPKRSSSDANKNKKYHTRRGVEY